MYCVVMADSHMVENKKVLLAQTLESLVQKCITAHIASLEQYDQMHRFDDDAALITQRILAQGNVRTVRSVANIASSPSLERISFSDLLTKVESKNSTLV